MTSLLLASLALAQSSTIEVPRSIYVAMLEATRPVGTSETAPAPLAVRREAILTVGEERIGLQARWDLEVERPGWVDLRLLGAAWHLERLTLGGRPVETTVVDGHLVLPVRLERSTTLELVATGPGRPRAGLSLDLLPAAVGSLRVETPDPVVAVRSQGQVVPRVDGTFWTGGGSLELQTLAERPAARSGSELVGFVGRGVTVGDGELTQAARLQVRIRGQRLDEVVFRLAAPAPDLTVEGPLVRSWTRSGERVVVQLTRPEDTLVELEARWTEDLPDRDQTAVALQPLQLEGTYRTERSLQLARAGDREIVPTLSGWTGIASGELPEIGRGLVSGTPTSTWVGTNVGSGSLALQRFKPVSGPATLVDVAAVNGVLSRDGRVLYRAHYTVRNDRGDFLRVRLGAGQRLVTATVGGEPARVARDGELYLVPLLKSVETVQGLLDFPVKLVVLGDGSPLARKAEREVELPVLDAPVAVTRVELALPEGWENELEPGEAHVVEAFSEGDGITYGFALGDGNVARADALYQDALQAWMANDFDQAQAALDDLKGLGAQNENIGRLQSNLDVVSGGKDDDSALSRRVKDQARARAEDDERKQLELEEEADEALATGDYEAAERAYQQALSIGQTLEKLEQKESREVVSQNAVLTDKLSRASSIAKRKKRSAPERAGRPLADEVAGSWGDAGSAPEEPLSATERDASVDLRQALEEQARRSEARYHEQLRVEAEQERIQREQARREAEEMARRRAEEERFRAQAESAAAMIELEDVQLEGTVGGAPVGDIGGGVGRAMRAAPRPAKGRSRRGPAKRKSAVPPPPAPPPAPSMAAESIAPGSFDDAAPEPVVVSTDRFDALEVTASDLDVVLPAAGEIVRYQHLILPAGEPATVVVRATGERGTR